MSASDDTTDAVADCSHAWFLGEFLAYCRLCKVPYHRSTRVHELEARIDDLEAKLAAMTRQRDEARELLAKRVWAEAENDPEFVKSHERGKADIEAGRTVQ